MKCHYCKNDCIRKGKTKNTQKYRCKSCLKYQREEYVYQACLVSDKQLVAYTKEGCGIRSTARLLYISPNTVINRIVKIGSSLKTNVPLIVGGIYEVDELFTYIGRKDNRVCIVYAIEQDTRRVVDFVVGRRNKQHLRKVLNTLFLADSKLIITDKLNLYKELIPSEIHSTKHRGINHIERKNLTLRTHIKRLNRRTICFSKSLTVLTAVLKIYFWG